MFAMGLARHERVCFLHVGTHKTGTTAIQRFLATNDTVLAAGGTYYPRAARLSPAFPGHHNIAHDLLGGKRADPSLGTFSDVLAEIADVCAPRVCLSSEDFEYLHIDPAAMIRLRDGLGRIGYRPVIILYVRAQNDYVEALFAELSKHRSVVGFDDFLAEILDEGIYRFDDGWVFRFDYTRIVEAFTAVFGSDAVIVRPYLNGGTAHALVRDFVELVDPARRPPEFYESAAYENVRPSVGDVIRRMFANAATHLGDDELIAVGAQYAERPNAHLPFAMLSRDQRIAVAARFWSDNAALAARWPLGPAVFARPLRADDGDESASRLFGEAEGARRAAMAGRIAPRRLTAR
jgi:hypothetical protein